MLRLRKSAAPLLPLLRLLPWLLLPLRPLPLPPPRLLPLPQLLLLPLPLLLPPALSRAPR